MRRHRSRVNARLVNGLVLQGGVANMTVGIVPPIARRHC
jgi:hypothetical protein